MTAIRIGAADAVAMARRQGELAAFERQFEYPLGADRFHIDHGRDYLTFFRALGEPFPYLAERAGQLLGVLVAVRRRLADRAVWYVCDLKVDPAVRGHGIARRLLRRWSEDRVDPRDAAFAVSMDGADGSNRMLPLAQRCPAAGPIATTRLLLFALDHTGWLRHAAALQRALGALGFHDPRGTKDIVLASTGQPMPLLHLQHGPWARQPLVAARPGASHMFCLPVHHALTSELQRAGVAPTASATVLHRHLDGIDWTNLSTSDI